MRPRHQMLFLQNREGKGEGKKGRAAGFLPGSVQTFKKKPGERGGRKGNAHFFSKRERRIGRHHIDGLKSEEGAARKEREIPSFNSFRRRRKERPLPRGEKGMTSLLISRGKGEKGIFFFLGWTLGRIHKARGGGGGKRRRGKPILSLCYAA